MVSSRISSIEESATLRLTRLAEDLRMSGKKVYNFGIGEPDFTTPQIVIDSAFEWAKRGKTHYTPAAGIRELRDSLARKMKMQNSVEVTGNSILVSPAKFAIYLSLFVTLEPGDEVLLLDPYYTSYRDIVKLVGGVPVEIPLREDYGIDFSQLEIAITGRTRAILFNNPSNPTGHVYPEKEIRELYDFCVKNHLYLISDEIYEDLIYEGSMFSPASIPGALDSVITVNGFSKSHAMTGWRIGYLVANEEIIKAATKVQGQTITCASSISQYGALEALKDDKDPVIFRETFRKRRDLVVKLLSEIPGYHVNRPAGAFYAFPGYPGDIASEKYSAELLEKYQVIITPGIAFGSKGEHHYRLSYAASEDELREGIARIAAFEKELSK